MIFDCCHSAGANRATGGGPGKEYSARELQNVPPIPKGCDDDIMKTDDLKGVFTPTSYYGEGIDSHIFLAACGRGQLAWEHSSGKGQFTDALLKALRTLKRFTYFSLMNQIKMLSS